MDEKKLEIMLNNLYLFHRFLRRNGFNYENFNRNKKMTFNHHLTLLLLKKRGKLSMSELKKLIGINKQSMTYITDTLVDNGLIHRVSDLNDRRVINIIITDKGHNYLNEWQKSKQEEIEKLFKLFNNEDLKMLYCSIKNISNTIIEMDN